MIIIEKLKLGYQDSPKIASTSLFHWLHNSMYGHSYSDRVNKPNVYIHEYYGLGKCPDVRIVKNDRKSVEEYQTFFRFAITRDPIKRFISMYSNRILHHRELSANSNIASQLKIDGLEFDPDINMLVTALEKYMTVQKSIFHHTRPQLDFLGNDLTIYNRIADISDVNKVIDEIKAHWMRNGLQELAESAPALGRAQTGGAKLGLEILNDESFDKLLEYYRGDYENIPTVSLQAIKNEYLEAKRQKASAKLTVNNENQNKQKNAGIKVNKINTPIVAEFWLHLPESGVEIGVPFVLQGALLMTADTNTADWQLYVSVDNNSSRLCDWFLPSPKLANSFPSHPGAKNARFNAEDVVVEKAETVDLYLQNTSGERCLVLQIKPAEAL
ncbi:sulfotransferase family 2 domain-containing protein [Methylobacter luteus]|uniref:sulfotransferase family 2 domain-containing protein n=1 Tax=Methylobacter luteus TaxID=415 RepID=UPI0003F58FB5|nr:sulfotransferase family 2 domain-containing protein [Methylobacter luteus]